MVLLALGLSGSGRAAVSANLTWTASSDPSVTGYNIYYGTASHQYSNSISVGTVTNAIISGLQDGLTYFFAAKARNSAGNESDFSNEAAFAGVTATPQGGIRLKTTSQIAGGDPVVYSLAPGAPAGMTINPTNGAISWVPGHQYASTTNYISVIVTDTVNPSQSLTETLVIVVADYLEFQLGATAVYAGQGGSLPITVDSSSSLTNVQLVVAWPGNQLLTPTLTYGGSIVSGSLQQQNQQLIIQLQSAANQPLTGSNLVAQVHFQSALSQPTATLNISAAAASGNAADGSTYSNITATPGEVSVVGSQSMLRPRAAAGASRTVSLLASPGTYQLQYATSLAAPVTWTPVMTYQQTNAAQDVSLTATNANIFYRLRQL